MGQRGEAHGPGHALERLIFFSDAVFAIAITLLVIEIHVPHVPRGASDLDFLIALAPLGPSFLGFFISFFVIGAFWAGHHRAFDCARHWDSRLVLPNLMMLSAIAAMPFFTALSSAYYGQRVPVALYTGWMLVTALLNIRLQRVATAPPVVGAHVTAAHRRMLRQRGVAVALGAATALIVSLLWPPFGQTGLASIFFWRLLIQRFDRAQPSG
jgi:uncharacterized membrane protein